MTRYPFFKKIIHSFYSKDLYTYVGSAEIGRNGFKYLFLLLCIFWIPEMVKMQVNLSNSIEHELPLFLEKFPTIQITNGVVSIDKPSPYVLQDDETGKELMIFDTSGETTSLEGSEAQLLLTESRLIIKKSNMETREYDLSSINDFTLTHERITSWAAWGNYLSILLYILIVPCALLYRMLMVLIYSLIGLIFQAILQTKCSFQTIYRLCTVAITPAFVIDKIFGYFDIDFTGWSLICFIISMGYLYFAMQANKPAENLSPADFRTDATTM